MSDATLLDLDPDNAASLNDFVMARTLAEALHRHYPGHLWGVNADGRRGIITIHDLYLSGQWGYVLKLADVYSISSLERDAVRAGGEILERFEVARSQFRADQYAEKKVDFAGRLLFDKS